MSDIYFTSDTHFGHANIIKYSKRPFGDVNEMNEFLIANWNKRVRPDDTIYHVGDFGFGQEEFLVRIMKRLNGRKHLLIGNHDERNIAKMPEFTNKWLSIQDRITLTIEGQKLILDHYPHFTWKAAHRGSWMLHGHCHHSVDWANSDTTRLDVGVDGPGFNYSPLSFKDVKAILSKRSYKIVDHHGKEVDSHGMEDM